MAQLDRLIPIINKLQDTFAQMNVDFGKFDLPQIAVVGAQSSGKSSVLENIVGRDFLPRGSGIVTRRPLVLQLMQADCEAHGEFLHRPGEKYFDFDAIRQEIEAVTEREVRGKGVSNIPINLKVYARDVIQLTLIDLPGITKVAVHGQDERIPGMIKEMVLSYIKKPSCIILAVSAANQDLANSDALKLAREVDPQGDRTIGVLTKVDLMDKGTDCVEVLEGKVVPLKKGYIGVVNRSQQDIEHKKDVRLALQAEKEFFENHPKYSAFAHRLGTPVLAKMLNVILLQHIRTTLPKLKTMVNDIVTKTQKMLRDLGGDENDLQQGALLLNLLTRYSDTVRQWIDGTAAEATSRTEIVGGARINRIFHNSLEESMKRVNPSQTLTEDHIRTIIDNAMGTRSALFVPEQAFESLVKIQIRMLEDPCQECTEQVHNELVKICELCEKELVRFPELKIRVNTKVRSLLLVYLEITKDFVRNLIHIENSYINTRHPSFYGGGMVMAQMTQSETQKHMQQQSAQMQQQQHHQAQQQQPHNPAQQQQQQNQAAAGARPGGPPANPPPTSGVPPRGGTLPPPQQVLGMGGMGGDVGFQGGNNRRNMEVTYIKEIISSYFTIVQTSMQDKLPKSVMYFLVDKLMHNLQNELVKEFYKEDLFEVLLKESDDIGARRKAAKAMLSVCLKAQGVLSEVEDYKL